MRPATITPTRFVTARHGGIPSDEHFRWSLASHALGACVRHPREVADVLTDGETWLSSAKAIWPEARGIDDPSSLKPLLDDRIGRQEVLNIRSRVASDVAWAQEHLGPGRPRQVGVSVTRTLDGLRIFGQIPFVLDDDGVWTLVALNDGGRSRDLVRCWAWLADSIPGSPGVQFIRLLDPVRRVVEEVLWDDQQRHRIEAELRDARAAAT